MAGERRTRTVPQERNSAGRILVLSSLVILFLFLALLKEMKKEEFDPAARVHLFAGRFTEAVYRVLDTNYIPRVELKTETGLRRKGDRAWSFYNMKLSVPARTSLTRLNLAITEAAESCGGLIHNAVLDDEGRILEIKAGTDSVETHRLFVKKLNELPLVAIIIDDFGYGLGDVEKGFFGISVPLTFAVIPGLPFTRAVADSAAAAGIEVILHQPMEPEEPGQDPGAGPILAGMRAGEIGKILEDGLGRVPGAVGVSNHMGSKAMADAAVVEAVIRYLEDRALFLLDSRTSAKSAYRGVAEKLGVVHLENECFIDAVEGRSALRKALSRLIENAKENGSAVGIAHNRRETLAYLKYALPRYHKKQVLFTPLSRLREFRGDGDE